MDLMWFKDAVAVIAQHGPWALLAFWLAWNLIREGRSNRQSQDRNTEALTALRVLIEGLSQRTSK